MTPGNFNWFLHTMLFLQTEYVLNKEKGKVSIAVEDVENDGGRDDISYDGGDVYTVRPMGPENHTPVWPFM